MSGSTVGACTPCREGVHAFNHAHEETASHVRHVVCTCTRIARAHPSTGSVNTSMLRTALRALPLRRPVHTGFGCTPALVRLASTGMNVHGVYDPNAEEEWVPKKDQAARVAAMSKAIDMRSDTGACMCVRVRACVHDCGAYTSVK